jgi:hypothetical protein
MPNLTRPDEWTLDECAALLKSKDDSIRRQLRVLSNGEVIISDKIGNEDIDTCKFALPTWLIGNGYTGPEAAEDKQWVERVHRAVQRFWDEGARGVVDDF